MAKRTRTHESLLDAPSAPAGRRPRPNIVHSSLYLPDAVHEALREIAFHERVKIHDLVLQGIDAVLKKRDYRSIESLASGKKR